MPGCDAILCTRETLGEKEINNMVRSGTTAGQNETDWNRRNGYYEVVKEVYGGPTVRKTDNALHMGDDVIVFHKRSHREGEKSLGFWQGRVHSIIRMHK